MGALLLVSYGVAGILGFDTDLGSPLMILAMPIAVQEMVFAGWLLVRGFGEPAGDRGGAREPRVDTVV